jgi:RNA polymerase sigma factor (sigma-70 family)
MKTSGLAHRDLSTLFEAGLTGGLLDAELLERFAIRRDEAAFEALVRRHGPLVWRVCRLILRHHHDAEDAFQATFLILARKAPTIVPREMLPNWLYGVARQTAIKAKHMAARRETRERRMTELPQPEALPQPIEIDLHEVLDQELSQLPARYRTPIILCHLEGKGHKEAATQLGWPVGTLSARLSRARRILASRLSRRGFTLSAGSLAVLTTWRAASASVPTSLINSTVKVVVLSAKNPLDQGLVAAEIIALTKSVLRAMLMSKIKTGSLILVVGAAIGVGLFARSAESPRRMQAEGGLGTQKRTAPNEQRFRGEGSRKLLQKLDWALTKVDTDNRRISALARWTWNSMANDEFASSGLQTGLHLSFSDLPVSTDAEILLDGKPAKLTDLVAIDNETFNVWYGLQLALQLSDDGTTITKIDARSHNAYFFLKSVDLTNRLISVGIGASGMMAAQDDLAVAEDAKILIRVGKQQFKEARFADLKAGMRISFELATKDGQIVIRGIRAEE